MCKNYYDVRTFGAVMSTGKNAGQVRGRQQFTFARSIDQVVPLEHSITRMAVAILPRPRSRKVIIVPWAASLRFLPRPYRCHGFISAPFADNRAGKNGTGFNEDDLKLFGKRCLNMFEYIIQ